MRIGCITTSIVPSKTANSIQAVKVCHAMKQIGHEVHLWVPEFQRADWHQIAEIYGITEQFEITWLPFSPKFKQYDFSWRSVRAAINWNADLVYTWALQAALFANMVKVPAAMEFHDFPMGFMGPKLFKMFMRSKTEKLIMTTTRALATGIEDRFNIHFDPKNLQIAPNGTDPERYLDLPNPEKARQVLGLKAGFTVGYTGHFYPGRGMDLLTNIAKEMPEVNFLWVGGQEKDIAPWQEILQIQSIHNVTITGFIPNSKLPMYQAAADILVMPYAKKIEGSSGGNIAPVINPMKMFDYLSTGRPIVASDIPVFHEILNEEIALFCDPETSTEWVTAIKKLSEDNSLRLSMQKNALDTSIKYSWKNRAEISTKKLKKILK
ncbi:MAG: glycosyltransferase [Pelolinea sp.]|nr:glycosyltransferase [Pelolinea sp.]